MHQPKSHNHTPAPEDGAEQDLSSDLIDQAVNEAAEEAEDFLADLEAEKYRTPNGFSKEVGD